MKDLFKKIWREPRRALDTNENRKISFLELFFDIIYVGYIARITHSFTEDINALHLFQYVILFLMGWMGWFNSSSYYDIHGNNDVRSRAFMFLQMFIIGWLGIFSHNAFGENFSMFSFTMALYILA
ncbi:MAG: low temperature requirement protein A [Bacilli bacterium]